MSQMTSEAFKKAYKNLNKEQKKAVDTIEGPVMVIAGPGTGKTSILTLRIANILEKTDTPANGILALTFTDSGVHSMRTKLKSYVGPSAYRVHIYTFHSFAQEIISRYPEYFPRIIGGVVAGDSERYRILEEAITKGEYETIRPFGKPTLYVRPALKAIEDLKRDGVTAEMFEEILNKEEKDIRSSEDLKHTKGRFKGSIKREYAEALRNNIKNKELTILYGEYEEALQKNGLYDYADMLLELVGALEGHPDLLRTLQEEYLYVLADEHQDANNLQNRILELLTDYRDTQNLFIVGDEKQAIYRFQGASLENFLYFQKKYPGATVVFLDSNYRSTQTILDASHELMVSTATDPKLRPRLKSARTRTTFSGKNLSGQGNGSVEPLINIVAYATGSDEEAGIANDIKKAIDAGVPATEIAVLTRTNAEIVSIGRALEGFSIPISLFTDDNVLTDREIAKLILLFRAVVAPENDELVGSVLFVDFLGINPVDAVKINRFASEHRISPLELLSGKKLPDGLADPKAISDFTNHFTQWIIKARNESALDLFLTIIGETRFQEYLLKKRESLEKIDKLAKLYDEISVFLTAHKEATLKDFMDSLEMLTRHGGSISFSRRALGAHGVSVMTAHKSKGLEWKKVYITNVSDTVWGNRRSVGKFKLPEPFGAPEESERNEDERRLFYVAMTRGKDRLISQFAEELPLEFVEKKDGKPSANSERISRATTIQESDARTVFDREYLKEIFLDQGLNATAINNYLDCPWRYFFKNLARLPDLPEPYLHFGTATHAALKAMGDSKREGKKFTERDFLKIFENDLHRHPLSRSDLALCIKKGKKSLPVYFEARNKSWHKNSLTEYAIESAHITLPNGTDILLRGRLDKLEPMEGNQVNVVDYKTGSYKTRNKILGLTQSSDGNIKRQLDFYQLLLFLHDNGKYDVVTGTIEFVEADDKGKLHSEVFEMSDEDGKRIKEEAIRIAEEILSFSFWNQYCDDPKCEYCALRKAMI